MAKLQQRHHRLLASAPRLDGRAMNQNDIPLVAGGLSAPWWVGVVNEWLGLVAVSLTIAVLIRNLWKGRKD